MASQPASASAIAWAWGLEALASFKEIDASTIKDLYLQSPMIFDDISENAREAVSFRILENLFELEATITKPFIRAPNPEAGFGLSDNCEDVLLQILKKRTDATHLQDETEKMKSDVEPFIMHKRSRLPKCALRKLKDTILEDKNPSLAFLKQTSGVLLQTKSHTSNAACNGSTSRVQGTAINPQSTSDTSHSYPPKKPKCFTRVSQLTENTFETKEKSDFYQKEISYADTKKQDFLNHVFKGREYHSSMMHWKESNLCMKCEKGSGGDGLLVCRSEACPFVFHGSCLVSVTCAREFYCPFCRYSRSITEFRVIEEKALAARNDMLVVFKGLKRDYQES